jgi:hypothetical protein
MEDDCVIAWLMVGKARSSILKAGRKRAGLRQHYYTHKQTNWDRERAIPTERPRLVGEADFANGWTDAWNQQV